MAPSASAARSAAHDLGPRDEAIRRGVRFLAFRLTEAGLACVYEPGLTSAPVLVSRAALAAVATDAALAAGATTELSPLEQRAQRERTALAEQLAQVRARRPEALRVAQREPYLATLAEVMIAQALRDGGPGPSARRSRRTAEAEVAARQANF